MIGISEFYEDCEIFITGGSGVVGKALIEKLLRSCHVRRIYLLLRAKKDMSIEQRLEKIRKAKVFQLLRETNIDAFEKLVPIPGDAILPNLGITPEYARCMEKVSIIFHCAATVRFDEPLKVALNLNVAGTLEALKFAETLKNLKIFMHVSTFFSNPYLKYVEPQFYPAPMDWQLCLKLLSADVCEEDLDVLTRKLITGFPNTYTFTKNLAESLVNDFRHRVPVVIYRPSIVLFSLDEPFAGYPPTLMGAMGLFALAGAGVVKTVYLDKSTRLDLTPQDVGIKCMMYYAKKAASQYQQGPLPAVPVYITSSCTHSPHTFHQMCMVMEDNNLWELAAFEKSFLIPGTHYTSCRFSYLFLVYTKQVLPALLGDGLLRLFGHKPILMGLVRKAFITLELMQPFLFNSFESAGITDIDNIIKETDGTDYELSRSLKMAATDLGLLNNCTIMVKNIRQYLLNEDPSTVAKAQKVVRIKRTIYNVIRAIMAYYILRWLYGVFMDVISTKI